MRCKSHVSILLANTTLVCCIFQEHFQTSRKESCCIDQRIRRRICPAGSMQHLSALQQQQRGERREGEGEEAVSAASKACGRCFQASINVANVVSPAQKVGKKAEREERDERDVARGQSCGGAECFISWTELSVQQRM